MAETKTPSAPQGATKMPTPDVGAASTPAEVMLQQARADVAAAEQALATAQEAQASEAASLAALEAQLQALQEAVQRAEAELEVQRKACRQLCINFGLAEQNIANKFAQVDADYKTPEKIKGKVWIDYAAARVNLDAARQAVTAKEAEIVAQSTTMTRAAALVAQCEIALKKARKHLNRVEKAASAYENIRQTLLASQFDDAAEGAAVAGLVRQMLGGPVEQDLPLLLASLMHEVRAEIAANAERICTLRGQGFSETDKAVQALKAAAGDADKLAAACEKIRDLTFNNAANEVPIREAGGIPAIVAALTAHKASAKVCEQACWALANLAANTANRDAVRAAGGIPAIVAALTAHKASAGVCEHACVALYNLTFTDANKPLIRAERAHIEYVVAHHTGKAKEWAQKALNRL